MENEKIKKAMQQAEASLRFEGLNVTEAHRKLVYSVLTSQITEEKFNEKVLDLIRKNNESTSI